MKKLYFMSAVLFAASATAQNADFETPLSQADTAWFGQGQTMSNVSTFQTGDFKFENKFTVSSWGSYSNGWSYSNITDVTTVGSANQFSNITGAGQASSQYGVCNVGATDRVFKNDETAFTPTEINVTNATYTYLSMQSGDAFAAQFGDVSNASLGQDSLVLSIYGLDMNMDRTDSVTVYLANFTNGNTLLVNTWLTVDLTALGSVYGLDFDLISSDNGTWGMNTPAYFAMDNLKATGLTDGDFETPPLASESKWNGSNQTLSLSTVFTSGYYDFENTYNMVSGTGYSQSWSYSNHSDVTTAGPANQYACNVGVGESSAQYGICNASSYANNRMFSTSKVAFTPTGAYFTNTTYATLSMQNGDNFTTQFGDVNNAVSGEDWFLLTIYGLGSDSTRTGDSVNYYLADYRFSDNTLDFIIDEWTWVDLSSLGSVYGLDFELSSSDVGQWGMNTPAYFAMDNFAATGIVGREELTINTLNVYPNPTTDLINITIEETNALYAITNLQGQVVLSNAITGYNTQIDVRNLSSGLYHISVITDAGIITKKFQKI